MTTLSNGLMRWALWCGRASEVELEHAALRAPFWPQRVVAQLEMYRRDALNR